MTDEPRADEAPTDPDREAILRRRQRFIAAALGGLATSLSTGCPQPCLSPPPPRTQKTAPPQVCLSPPMPKKTTPPPVPADRRGEDERTGAEEGETDAGEDARTGGEEPTGGGRKTGGEEKTAAPVPCLSPVRPRKTDEDG